MLSRNVKLLDPVEPFCLEIGVPQDFAVYHGQRPGILVDEIVYYPEKLPAETMERNTAQWHEEHDPVPGK